MPYLYLTSTSNKYIDDMYVWVNSIQYIYDVILQGVLADYCKEESPMIPGIVVNFSYFKPFNDLRLQCTNNST